VANTRALAETSKRLGTYGLIAVVLAAPFGPFWYVESAVGRQASLAHIGGALVTGSLVLLCGLVVLERYAGIRALTIASFDGFFLGLLGSASGFPDSPGDSCGRNCAENRNRMWAKPNPAEGPPSHVSLRYRGVVTSLFTRAVAPESARKFDWGDISAPTIQISLKAI